MPRAGDRRRRGLTWKDHRRRGIGAIAPASPAAYDNPPATDAVNAAYDLLSVSAIIGGANEYICTGAVNEVYDLLTVVYP